MKRLLFLMRHAQSADKQPGQADKERELTPQGIRDTIKIGTHLYGQKINLDLILSSTATRAKFTSELMLDTLKLMPEKIQLDDELYDASTRTFLNRITQLEDNNNSVLCVGHNPGISYLAEYLTKAEVGDLTPAGLVIIEFEILLWHKIGEATGKLIAVVTPQTV